MSAVPATVAAGHRGQAEHHTEPPPEDRPDRPEVPEAADRPDQDEEEVHHEVGAEDGSDAGPALADRLFGRHDVREVGQHGLQLGAGASGERCLDPISELVHVEAAVGQVEAELLDDRVPLGVGDTLVRAAADRRASRPLPGALGHVVHGGLPRQGRQCRSPSIERASAQK